MGKNHHDNNDLVLKPGYDKIMVPKDFYVLFLRIWFHDRFHIRFHGKEGYRWN